MSDTDKIRAQMLQGLQPMDSSLFTEVLESVDRMTKLEIHRFVKDPSVFPALDTGIENLNNRVNVYARQLSLENSFEATAAPAADGSETPAGEKARLTKEEKDAEDITNKCLRAVDASMGEERRAASDHLRKAQLALTTAQHEEQAAAANPSIGTKAQLAAKNAAIVAKNGVKNALKADIDAQAKYAGAMRSLMPAAKPGGVLGMLDAPEPAKPPPLNG